MKTLRHTQKGFVHNLHNMRDLIQSMRTKIRVLYFLYNLGYISNVSYSVDSVKDVCFL